MKVEGFYCLEGSSQRPNSQLLCPQGYYCEEGTATPHGSPCPAGTAGEQLGQTSRAACKRCREGRFCPAGVKDCLKCPHGFYCPEGTSDPVPCPPGSFNPLEGQDELADCRDCYAGKACTQVALRAPDVDCMQGFVCPPGSSKPNAATNACPPGTLSNRTDLTDRSQCQQCPAGYACLRGTGGIQRPPLSCFAGHYCPPGTMFPTQYSCPVGTWSGHSGLQAESECQLCPQGWYCLAGAGAPSGRCSSGHYCPEGRSTFRRVKGGRRLEDCSTCPAGYFCPQSAIVNPRVCGAGSYSDEGSVECSPCLQGHYCSNETTSEEAMLSIMVCPPGFLCSQGLARDPQRSATLCPRGFYCPGGGIDPNPISCPNGTYSDSPGLRDVSECVQCPEGKYCYSEQPYEQPITRPVAVTSGGMCPAGFICPRGTMYPQQHPCPLGTFSNTLGAKDVSSCWPCPPGLYCNSTGLSQPSGVCHTGYYCSGGAVSPTPTDGETGDICPAGHFCPMGSSSPVVCPDGTFSNSTGADMCKDCPPGTYCLSEQGVQPCPAGHYCLGGGVESILPCPPGTYSPHFGLSQVEQCLICPAGFYCEDWGLFEPTGPCQAGYYCIGGSEGGLCPPAHYCPDGSASPLPCPAGTYTNLTGQSVCSRCPAGYYCPEKTANFTKFPCPPGFYCPDGTRHATQFPCPRGYYNPESMTQSLDSCLPCPPGQYCEKERLTKVSGKCKAGWFCVSAAWNSQPFDLDNYTNANCLCPATSTGGRCQVGYYCPIGSSEPLPCPPGTFCNISGLALPMGPCSPGYYCVRGATEASPTDGETGNICPPGTYCVEGSEEPEMCPPGTFSPVPGVSSEAGCQPCTAGFYCGGPGLRLPTGPCSQGYWCPPGQTVATALPCPLNHFCPHGSAAPEPCPPGTYQDREKQAVCTICKAGYYCDIRLGRANASLLWPCPKGHYCPAGTSLSNGHPCPVGSFNPRQGIDSPAGCIPCAAGQYCPSVGLSEPSGTTAPIVCPEGSWSNSSGLSRQEDCKPCLGGFYCDSVGLTKPSGSCSGGYYCLEGAVTPTPTDGITGGPCPESYYCPEGTVQPVPCDPGTYVAVTLATKCDPCVPGWYCVSGSLYLCPAGFYCPEGTGFDLRGCPEGTYGPDPGYWSVSQCRQCDGGHYCSSRNGTAVTGPCQEGHYCLRGNTSPQPLSPASEEGGPCPAGHYCPRASDHPLPCPRGTFSNLTKLISQEDCQPCLPGYYCAVVGLTTPSGKCWKGFFCLGGADRPDPPLRDSRGGPCPKGSFCASPGKAVTSGLCSAGYYCLSGAWSPTPDDGGMTGDRCPKGHYCPQGSLAPLPCPLGLYSNKTGNTHLSECLPCPPGFLCDTRGLCFPSHLCPPGFYCPGRENSSQPASIPCSPGNMCPPGSDLQVPCSPGTYQDLPGKPDESPTGGRCSAGSYCPEGTSYMVPCPAGTFSSMDGAVSIEACRSCLPGHYCAEVGLSSPSGPCTPGFYCTEGSRTATPWGNTTGLLSQLQEMPHLHPQFLAIQPRVSSMVMCAPQATIVLKGVHSQAHVLQDVSVSLAIHAHMVVLNPPFVVLALFSLHLDSPFVTSAHQVSLVDLQLSLASCVLQVTTATRVAELSQVASVQKATTVLRGRVLRDHNNMSAQQDITVRRAVSDRQPAFQAATSSDMARAAVRHALLVSIVKIKERLSLLGHVLQGLFVLEVHLNLHHQTVGLDSYALLDSFVLQGHLCQNHAQKEHSVSRVGLQMTLSVVAAFLASTVQRQGSLLSLDPACQVYLEVFVQKATTVQKAVVYPHPVQLALTNMRLVEKAKMTANHALLDLSGQKECNPCPPGYHCQPLSPSPTRGSSTGVSVPLPCPAGYICPSQSPHSQPVPCPKGTFNPSQGLITIGECLICPAGQFCGSEGLVEPSGSCAAGFLCLTGATVPNPTDNRTGSLCPPGIFCQQGQQAGECWAGFYCDWGSSRADQAVCPAGFFCPSGTTIPMPCPAGAFSSETGNTHQDNCTVCTPGYYCEVEGTVQPVLCPVGYYCPPGLTLGFEFPCPPGTVQSRRGVSSPDACLPCPSGMFCSHPALSQPTGPCEAGYYCPTGSPSPNSTEYQVVCLFFVDSAAGTALPEPCPRGTFSNQTGAHSYSVCTPCPSGVYCSSYGASTPQGSCLEGHFCQGGALGPTPQNSDNFPRNGPCPVGHYCPAGCLSPIPCPNGSIRNTIGGVSMESCTSCPAGYYCSNEGLSNPSGPCAAGFYCPFDFSSTTPYAFLCPKGHYCPEGSALALPCPTGEYQPNPGTDSCIPCRPGFYCEEAIVGEPWPCPPHSFCPAGFYCPEGTEEAQLCPANTVRIFSGGASVQDCLPCPPQYWCKPGNPILYLCPAGHYCDGLPGSDFNGGTGPRPCPLYTYRASPGAGSKGDCLPCPPGSHCNSTALTDYTNSPCPPGHWCSGSGPPILCPPGTMRQLPGAGTPGQCEPCAGGTFCPDPRATGKPNVEGVPCRPSYQCPVGKFMNIVDIVGILASVIYCCNDVSLMIQVQSQRDCAELALTVDLRLLILKSVLKVIFVLRDPIPTIPQNNCTAHYKIKICPLGTGFIFYNELDFKSSISDSRLDCQPEVNRRCAAGQTVKDLLGPDIHVRKIKKVHLVQFDSEGVFGWIPTRRDLVNQLLSEPIEFLNPGHRMRRDTEGDDDPDGDLVVLPRIPNPIACLSCGDMLIFHLTINHTDRHMSHFPVYQKDHLFNSNPSWDFGAFRRLQILMKQTNFNSTRFAHVFSETGKYVFVDSAVPEWSMVVVVSEEGTECDPRAAIFQPMTPAKLVKYGIVKRHGLNLLPDWGVITGILSLLVVAVVVLTTTVLVLQPSKAKLVSQWKTKPKWRSLGEPFCPVECVCNKDSIAAPSMGGILGIRGVGEGAEAEEPSISKGGIVSGHRDLEEFNVKTLYDKLEDQNLHIASQLARHRKDTQEFYRNICEQTEKLKNVFENMDYKKLSLLKELLVHKAMRDNGIGVEKNAKGPHDARECEPQAGYAQPGDTNMCYIQFPSMTKAEALPHEPVHIQTAAPCLSDHDLSKLVTISPLFKTLQDIQQALQNLTTTEPSQHLHDGDFYFDVTNQILYVSEAKIQHVGHFIAIILQSMAYIASASKPQSFVQALHEAISSLSLQLFSLSFKWSTAERATPTSMPRLNRNGTILLELKRRYVSQRLNELQITLGQMRQCQLQDSKPKDLTGGCTQTDSSTTQMGQKEHYPCVDVCSPADGQWQEKISASQSHSQQSVESRGLGNYKLKSHIPDQQSSNTVHSNNP
ncbi:Sushi, von Willebrand factor type A, EGF and pentraxin domain-containing protein 1 [Channa argus]|uniref:Sushi, von Willebrand factor type A, EGF and pentraxin domain-containing protein 1 n=1 Tax=Channa argus TaxID=215402 RepID=A0A6G1PRN2_CHAAH|nr:Sushi, von Willebrand factor type A, EGF and pentraxin domain-containing protein 1 [Channa argus]